MLSCGKSMGHADSGLQAAQCWFLSTTGAGFWILQTPLPSGWLLPHPQSASFSPFVNPDTCSLPARRGQFINKVGSALITWPICNRTDLIQHLHGLLHLPEDRL